MEDAREEADKGCGCTPCGAPISRPNASARHAQKMAMLPTHTQLVSAHASEWGEQRAHEKVFPKRRGVLRTRQTTRESRDWWGPGALG